MRERLRRSERRDRVFQVVLDTAAAAGLVGRRMVLDSTPLYDAVATMDTITLVRSAMRGLLAVAGEELETQLRAVCGSGDDHASSATPQIDWEEWLPVQPTEGAEATRSSGSQAYEVAYPAVSAVMEVWPSGSVFKVGRMGMRKAALSALAHQRFGADFHPGALPDPWSSTENALEAAVVAAMDACTPRDRPGAPRCRCG